MLSNSQSQRSTATVAVASIAAASIVDVTIAASNARFSTVAGRTDGVVVNPSTAMAGLTGFVSPYVSANGVISARATNPSTATIAAQTVTVNIELLKATGAI